MVKILIVEDEAGIRNALLSDYDWAALDCVVSCASSGIEAIEMCIQSPPDIVITDIVIPGIDGITLFKYLKYKNTNALFIIMTGHRDFEYAKDSLNLGAFAFLLKPIQREEFLNVITRAIEAYQKSESISNEFLEEQTVSNLFLGLPTNIKLADEKLQQTLLTHSRYSIYVSDFDFAEDRHSENLKNLYLFCKNALVKEHVLVARMDNYRLAFLLPYTKTPTDENVRTYLIMLQKSIYRAFKYTVSFGVSSVIESIERVGEAYIEATRALSLRFFSGLNSINFFSDFSDTEGKPEVDIQFDTYQMVQFAESMVDTISSNDANRVSERVDDITEKLAEMCKSDEALFRSAVSCIATLCLKLVYKENRRQLSLMLKKYNCFKQIITNSALADIKDMMTSLIIDLGDYVAEKGNINKKSILNRVMSYIEEHYAEEISLTSLAQSVYLSPSYLCTMISVETGKTFVDTLNNYRIKKSIELLHDPGLKNYMIACKVGFKEAQYFSYIFKKYTGVSPTEYRQLYLTADSPGSQDSLE